MSEPITCPIHKTIMLQSKSVKFEGEEVDIEAFTYVCPDGCSLEGVRGYE